MWRAAWAPGGARRAESGRKEASDTFDIANLHRTNLNTSNLWGGGATAERLWRAAVLDARSTHAHTHTRQDMAAGGPVPAGGSTPTPTSTSTLLLLLVVACTGEIVILGTAYAFPLWLVGFKSDFSATQLQANVIGIVFYLSASCVGMPLAPVLLGRLSAAQAAAYVTGTCSLGFFLLYLLADHRLGHSNGVFVVLLVAIVIIMSSSGVWFSFAASKMMPHYHALLVSGILCVGISGGGALAGILFAYGGLSLADNLLVITGLQAAAAPLFTWFVAIHDRASQRQMVALASGIPNDSLGDKDADDVPLAQYSYTEWADGEARPVSSPDPPAASAATAAQPWRPFLAALMASVDFYLVVLLVVLKVGIGGSFMTNLGTILQTTLSPDASQDHINSRVGVAIIIANFGQLGGRLLITLFSLRPIRNNANINTVATLVVVSGMYIACFAGLLNLENTQTAVLVMAGVFGFAYGMMWTTSSALIALLPLVEPVPRLLALIFPFGGIGTLSLNLATGAIYDSHVSPHNTTTSTQSDSSNICYGRACYHDTYIVWLALSCALFITSIATAARLASKRAAEL